MKDSHFPKIGLCKRLKSLGFGHCSNSWYEATEKKTKEPYPPYVSDMFRLSLVSYTYSYVKAPTVSEMLDFLSENGIETAIRYSADSVTISLSGTFVLGETAYSNLPDGLAISCIAYLENR